MAFCSKCGTQINDGAKFCPKCGQPTNAASQQQVSQPQQQYAAQQPQQQYAAQQPQQQPIKPDSNMILAILSTLFCCLPTGIYAIILANKVDKLYYAGQYDEAQEAASGAKKWSIIGAVLAVIGILFYFVFFVLLAAGAAASQY